MTTQLGLFSYPRSVITMNAYLAGTVIKRNACWAIPFKKYSCKFKCDKQLDSYTGATFVNDCQYRKWRLDWLSALLITVIPLQGINKFFKLSFKLSSIISYFSRFVSFNKMLFIKGDYISNKVRHFTGERIKNMFFLYATCKGVSQFDTKNCIYKQCHVPRTVLSNYSNVTLLGRHNLINNIDTRSISSKAGKIVIGGERESWEMLVDYDKLSALEKKIHERHRNAVKQNQLMYTDPQTGYQVMTRVAHLQRGECCGNACRHCPFGQANAPAEKRKKFNTAFYI